MIRFRPLISPFSYLLPSALICLLLASCQPPVPAYKTSRTPSHAGEALKMWGLARTFPDGRFHTEKYAEAMDRMQLAARLRGNRSNAWEALGPKNIGGRTLCLAVHPADSSILYAGSASGGLWKSETAGIGPDAWQYVETGFPVLGVSAIAIDPSDPDVMYLGTGEVYNVENSMPNVAVRVTRGTYGIGILKSTDGGATWSKALDWAYGDLRGVQDIKLNPLRPATVYAATSEGLLRSYDGGASWQTVSNKKMAVDIELHPTDTNIVFVTHGSLDDLNTGIYRSTNAGNTFSKMNVGLPGSYTGKTLLAMAPSNPNIIYASVADKFAQRGLYRSENGGSSWTLKNAEDVCAYQGWYSHDVTVDPADPNTLIWVGIDAWKSTDGGETIQKQTAWNAWYFGLVPAGGPEGPPHYVHADIHRAYYAGPDKVYVVTDGGIFVSYTDGLTWDGRNGGYQTQQFYANLGNSTTNPNLAIGGMQDNSTAIFTGEPDWTRVLGGDGECAGIDPSDDQIMYGSSQYLNMYRSTTGGTNWQNISPDGAGPEDVAFNGPFEIAPSEPSILYAGAQSLFRSDDRGSNWENVSGGPVAGPDIVLNIAVSPSDADLVYVSTYPFASTTARLFRLNAATGAKTEMTGLPNRMCMDIAIHPTDNNKVYAVFGGFNTEHVYRTADGGATWEAVDHGDLPDVPTNTVFIDPNIPDHVYIGNDLGVWFSPDAGESWELYSGDAPKSLLVMHLSHSPVDNKLRVTTYGLGVWQTDLAPVVSAPEPQALTVRIQTVRPNPVVASARIAFTLERGEELTLSVLDAAGRTVVAPRRERLAAGAHERTLDLGALPAGWYGIVLETKNGRVAKAVVKR
jgi:photosystem II stability/assembly factor-like uncharacterized protein